MAEIVSLRMAKKARARAKAEGAAAANRAAFGRTKAEKDVARTEVDRRSGLLDGAKLDH